MYKDDKESALDNASRCNARIRAFIFLSEESNCIDQHKMMEYQIMYTLWMNISEHAEMKCDNSRMDLLELTTTASKNRRRSTAEKKHLGTCPSSFIQLRLGFLWWQSRRIIKLYQTQLLKNYTKAKTLPGKSELYKLLVPYCLYRYNIFLLCVGV